MAVPTVIQHVSCSNTRGQGFGTGVSADTYFALLPNPTQAGDCLIVAAQTDNTGSPTFTITDDAPGGSNTYTLCKDENDTSNVQRAVLYIAMNCKAGARQISVATAGSNLQGSVSVAVTEVSNIATSSAMDTGAGFGNFGTGASCQAGLTGALVTGDFIYQAVFQFTAGNTIAAGSQANITWKLLSADVQDQMAVQCGVYNATASFNPTITQSASGHFLTVAVALKAASSGGSVPSGISANAIEHISLWSATGGGPGYSTTAAVQFPCYGNLLIASVGTGNGGSVTGITDNKGNTWVKAGAGIASTPHTMNIFYAASPTVGTDLVLTVTSSDNVSDTTILLYDVTGAAASPLDTTASNSGNQTTAVNSLNGPTITPTTSNGLVLANIQQETNTENGISSPSGGFFDSSLYSDESLNGPENVDQNGGWLHYNNPNTSAITVTWTFLANAVLGRWASYAAAFKAGAGVLVPGLNQPTAGPSMRI